MSFLIELPRSRCKDWTDDTQTRKTKVRNLRTIESPTYTDTKNKTTANKKKIANKKRVKANAIMDDDHKEMVSNLHLLRRKNQKHNKKAIKQGHSLGCTSDIYPLIHFRPCLPAHIPAPNRAFQYASSRAQRPTHRPAPPAPRPTPTPSSRPHLPHPA
jgi:hypothetical protein